MLTMTTGLMPARSRFAERLSVRLLVLALLLLLLFGCEAHAAGPGQAVTVYDEHGNPVGTGTSPASDTHTPANSSHALGTSVGGVFIIPLGRHATLAQLSIKSSGGNTASYLVRIWNQYPLSTCTDNVAFLHVAGDYTHSLPGAPFVIIPVAPAATTGDSSTYGTVSLLYPYTNTDVPATANIYVCLVAVSIDASDANNPVTVQALGWQN